MSIKTRAEHHQPCRVFFSPSFFFFFSYSLTSYVVFLFLFSPTPPTRFSLPAAPRTERSGLGFGLAEESKRQKRPPGDGEPWNTGQKRKEQREKWQHDAQRERQVRMLTIGASAAHSAILWRRATNVDECRVAVAQVTRSCVRMRNFHGLEELKGIDSCLPVKEDNTGRPKRPTNDFGIISFRGQCLVIFFIGFFFSSYNGIWKSFTHFQTLWSSRTQIEREMEKVVR